MTSYLVQVRKCDAIRRDKTCGREWRGRFPATNSLTQHPIRGWVRVNLDEPYAGERPFVVESSRLADICPICAMALGLVTYDAVMPSPISEILKRDWEEEVERVKNQDGVRLPLEVLPCPDAM